MKNQDGCGKHNDYNNFHGNQGLPQNSQLKFAKKSN